MVQLPETKSYKRIIVCCDGTWLNSDDGYDERTHVLDNPSNVTRFARALTTEGNDGIPQITYYQAGVGSSKESWDHINAGATGFGLDEHIREAYAFIAQNWRPGDKIFLVGFSRGAFTARSIAGLIATVGILTRSGMSHFYRIFKDFENMNDQKYVNLVPGLPIPKEFLPLGGNGNQLKYVNYLRTCAKTPDGDPDPLTYYEDPTPGNPYPEPQITALGVWDTVGALGIPGIWIIDHIKRMLNLSVARDEMKFYDTNLAPRIQYAFQALALDEMRYSFEPAVWARPAGMTTKLKQVWFPGVHGSVGGGNDDPELSDVSLAWMMDQMSRFQLDFDKKYINTQFCGLAQRRTPPKASRLHKPHKVYRLGNSYRPWSEGLIDTKKNSWIYRIAGSHFVRTPGQYCKIDKDSGRPIKDPQTHLAEPLEDTQERVHSSIRIRLVRNGPGINDNSAGYKAEALTPRSKWQIMAQPRHGWKVEKIDKNQHDKIVDALQEGFKGEEPTAKFLWRSRNPTVGMRGFPEVMLEEPIGPYELMLLKQDSEYSKMGEIFERIPKSFS